ncbi:hypothetical protein MGSAQ_000210, partial [marine sediment metagenome]
EESNALWFMPNDKGQYGLMLYSKATPPLR